MTAAALVRPAGMVSVNGATGAKPTTPGSPEPVTVTVTSVGPAPSHSRAGLASSITLRASPRVTVRV